MEGIIVIAYGGNAMMPSGSDGTLEEQWANVRNMSEALAGLVSAGRRVVVVHGNGPQVGELMLRSDLTRDRMPPLTLDVAGALSSGQIGYMVQQEVGNALRRRVHPVTPVTVLTQSVVAADDPAFQVPTKPIGRFYPPAEAEQLRRERGWIMVEDAGRGYRRVVPSPHPTDIVEWPAIAALIEAGLLVIACGGGGVPVVEEGGALRGVEAVVDKDLAAQVLATRLCAELLVLLTEVEAVAVNYGTPDQEVLGAVTLDQMEAYYREGQFPAGSMGPKVAAAIRFLRGGGRRAVITSADHLAAAVSGKCGTRIAARAAEAATA